MGTRKAITLVETLVAIGIILIVAAIAFPVFSAVKEKSLETKSVSNMRQLHVALESYRVDHDGIPVGTMEAMGLPPWPSERYLGASVRRLNPPKLGEDSIYYYYPAPEAIDHRLPKWAEYVLDKGDATVLVADVWFNPEGPSGIYTRYYANPRVEKYVFGITLGGSLRKKRALGELDLAWWDR